MTQQLTLADLELHPGTLDGFTPEQIAEVVQAATDGAIARISTLLGNPAAKMLDVDTLGWDATIAELEKVMLGGQVTDSEGWTWRRTHNELWSGPDGVVATEHLLARSKGRLYVVGAPREADPHEGVMDDARIQLEVSR